MLTGDSLMIRYEVNNISAGLTITKAIESPKVFQLKKQLGMEMLVKIVSAIIKSFCDSTKSTRTMDAIDILECAELFIETYTHESIKELVFALKQAKKRGSQFYNQVNQETIFSIMNQYMEEKSKHLENEHYDRISLNDGEIRTEAYSRAMEAEARQKRQEKMYEQKELNQVNAEKKEIKKLKDTIEKLIDGID